MLSTRPYVHAGFLRSWTAQGFQERLVGRVRDVVAAMSLKGRRARIFVTGEHAEMQYFGYGEQMQAGRQLVLLSSRMHIVHLVCSLL